MREEIQNKFFEEVISKINNIPGIDFVYFLGDDYRVIKEQSYKGNNNYLEQILAIIKSESLFEKISAKFYTKPFHTYTLLNENGLIIVSKLKQQDNLYMVVIAGENEPVDLINLLKICKETRLVSKN